jgi:hypothetical protein
LAIVWTLGLAACSSDDVKVADAPLASIDAPVDAAVDAAVVLDARIDAGFICPDGSVPSCPICGQPPPDPFHCTQNGLAVECSPTICEITPDCKFDPPECEMNCVICAGGCAECDPTTRTWYIIEDDTCFFYEYCISHMADAGT